MTDKQVALVLIRELMFRISRKGRSTGRAWWLHLSPKMIIKYINCPSAAALRSWLREQYPDHPKGAYWNIDPEMALDIVKHFGLA